MVKFTKGYVDVVISMFFDPEEAKKFLSEELTELRNQNKVSHDHFLKMKVYIWNHK